MREIIFILIWIIIAIDSQIINSGYYPLIIVSNILNRLTAFTACG